MTGQPNPLSSGSCCILSALAPPVWLGRPPARHRSTGHCPVDGTSVIHGYALWRAGFVFCVLCSVSFRFVSFRLVFGCAQNSACCVAVLVIMYYYNTAVCLLGKYKYIHTIIETTHTSTAKYVNRGSITPMLLLFSQSSSFALSMSSGVPSISP